MLILAPERLLSRASDATGENAVLVDGATIRAVDRLALLRDAFPQATVHPLPGCVLAPGFVNAHQHGRGISQILMGYPDDALEPWIAARAMHGAPDIYATTRVAAEAMIANGVTACVHANYAYGTGNYADELDASIRAYADSGLRATICIGYQDRGWPRYSSATVEPARAPYAGGTARTIALLEELRDRYRDCPTLTFALGPAGPQWVSEEAWQALARHAARSGVGIHFHLLESPAQAQACRELYGDSTLSFLRKLGVFNARTSFAHGVFMTAGDIAVARDEGAVAVVNPGSNMRLFNGAPPVADMIEAGCTLAVGTDNCALSDDEDYLRELRLVQLLARRPGIDARGPDAERMLQSATWGGAQAAFLGAGAGSIEPGAPADLIALELAPITADLSFTQSQLADLVICRGQGAHVRLTMVAGRTLYRAAPEDLARMDHWRSRAANSVEARETREAGAVQNFRADLRRHYREKLSERQA